MKILSSNEIDKFKKTIDVPKTVLNSYLKTGTYAEALEYINANTDNYQNWLKLHPAKRLLITSLLAHGDSGITLSERKMEETLNDMNFRSFMNGDMHFGKPEQALKYLKPLTTKTNPLSDQEINHTCSCLGNYYQKRYLDNLGSEGKPDLHKLTLCFGRVGHLL